MKHGQETVFLQKRRGFIRLAMQTGSHVVPCFAFGQTAAFSWYRPGPPLVSDAAVQTFSRKIGAHRLLGSTSSCAAATSPWRQVHM
jgi:2-acylglycerol O-acyltransferase 2